MEFDPQNVARGVKALLQHKYGKLSQVVAVSSGFGWTVEVEMEEDLTLEDWQFVRDTLPEGFDIRSK